MHIIHLAPALAALASLIQSTNAHSWVQQLNNIGPNGLFVGAPGFPRGYVPQFNNQAWKDDDMLWLLPKDGLPTGNRITDDMMMCHPAQRTNVQSPGFPVLSASPGSMIALQYQENGHTTQPYVNAGKPANGGTIYIYGTSDPKPDEKFNQIHKVWNKDGTGGDKRGKLIATRDFDDKQCYQDSNVTIAMQRKAAYPILDPQSQPMQSDALYCQNDIALPPDMPVGKLYTLYWVWDWPTFPGYDIPPNKNAGQTVSPGKTVDKLQYYTSCVSISPQTQSGNVAMKADNIKINPKNVNLNVAGILSQLTGGPFMASEMPDQPLSSTQTFTGIAYQAATSMNVASAPAATPTPSSPAPIPSTPAAPAPAPSSSAAAAPAPSSPAAAAPSAPSTPAAVAAAGGPSTSVVMVTVTPTITVTPSPAGNAAAATGPETSTTMVVVTIRATTTVIGSGQQPTGSASMEAPQATDSTSSMSGQSFQTASSTPAAYATAMPNSNCTRIQKRSQIFKGLFSGGTVKRDAEVEDKVQGRGLNRLERARAMRGE